MEPKTGLISPTAAPSALPSSSHSFPDLQDMAEVIARSGLFPQFKTPQQVLALMLLCQAKGLHPMTATERYHIVQGRPVKRADAMLGDFIAAGGTVEWHKRSDTVADATFSHPSGGSVRVAWTIEMARSASLTGKDVWRQYPRQMLHARCVSEGCRSLFPGATDGLYTPEEAANMKPEEAAPASRERERESERETVLEVSFTPQVNGDDRPTGTGTPTSGARPMMSFAPGAEDAIREYCEVATKWGKSIRWTKGMGWSKKEALESAETVMVANGRGRDHNWFTPEPWIEAKSFFKALPAGSIDLPDPFAEDAAVGNGGEGDA